MATTLVDISAIQQAIRQLTRHQRERLAEWILNSGEFGDRIAETEPAWGEEKPRRLLSVEEYLQLEYDGFRYEYIAGETFVMNSPNLRHRVIVANVLANLHMQMRGGPCKVLSSNVSVRLRVDESEIFYLPDVTIACGPFSQDSLNLEYLTDPTVVIEVSSPATEATDRREKALNYRHLPSLEEYVLIAQRPLSVTVYRRAEHWMPTVLTQLDAVVEFHAVEAHMTLAEIYEGAR
jgi:Uma2 family endonuclease